MTLIKTKQANELSPASFSDFIDNFLKDSFGTNYTNRAVKFLPGVDIAEDEKTYEISLAVPGLNKEDFKINLEENKLTISGERKLVKEDDSKKYHTIETQYGSFSRTFYLPQLANTEAISAEYVNGILKLSIPKDEKKTLKTNIEVK